MKVKFLFAFSMMFLAAGLFYFWQETNSDSLSVQDSAQVAEADLKNKKQNEESGMQESLSRMPTSERDLEKEVADLNQIIFSIKNGEGAEAEVTRALQEIQQFAQENPGNKAAQIYATVAETIPYFKGIIWRLRDIVEPVDAAYIGILNSLRAFKRNEDRRAQHIDALFDYLTNPNPNEAIGPEKSAQKGMFISAGQFQDYMAKVVLPHITKQIKKLRAIEQKHAKPNEALMLFDARLIFGSSVTVVSPTVQYRKFMPAHLFGMIANMYERVGFGYYLASYDLEKLSYFLNTLASRTFASKKSSFDGKGLITRVFDVHIQSPKEVSQLFAEQSGKQLAHFLTLRKVAKDGNYLKESFDNLQLAAENRKYAFRLMQSLNKLGNANSYFINPDFITSRPGVTLAILEKRHRLFSQGSVSFSDRVSGRSFDINLFALFNKENLGIQDLKKLFPYPKQFNSEVQEKNGRDPKTWKWDYTYGAPQAWPDPTFAGLLPGTQSPEKFRENVNSISRDGSLPALQAWLRMFM